MKLSLEEFWSKSQWEGGFYDLANYGLKANEIKDKQLAKLWKEYYNIIKYITKKEKEILDYLESKGIDLI